MKRRTFIGDQSFTIQLLERGLLRCAQEGRKKGNHGAMLRTTLYPEGGGKEQWPHSLSRFRTSRKKGEGGPRSYLIRDNETYRRQGADGFITFIV